MIDDPVANYRRIRKLLKRMNRGETVVWGELLDLCPYQTVFGVEGMTSEIANTVRPDAIIGVFGSTPDDFSTKMREEIVATIRAGKVVRLISNKAELRDYAKREISLALWGGITRH